MSAAEKDLAMAKHIATSVEKHGGRAYFVGGYVRDFLLSKDNKDIDIEIHGITSVQLEEILDSIGERISIGESFGIYGIKGYFLDIAMPRKEKVRGTGHKDFDIFVDPFIGTYKAAQRRDFTVNAMMQDVLTGEIVDHFGGRKDLDNGIIRHVNDDSFVEDPLRVLRAAQFAARFEFKVASETIELCSRMELSHLPKERIETELRKALLKADKPSIFFEVLLEMNCLSEWFPEVQALIGIEQSKIHHLEGDVWTHTMMVLDEAVKYRDKVAEPFAFMLAALTHDFGKAACTEIINGEIHSYEHEIKGLPIAERFLRRITNESKVIEYVLNLAKYHMKPNTVALAGSSVKVTNRMFDRAIDPEALIYIALADGRGKISAYPYVSCEDFLMERLEIYKEYMDRPYVKGEDLIAAGLKPGKYFSELLVYSHKLRLAGIDKESALKQTLAYARKVEKG